MDNYGLQMHELVRQGYTVALQVTSGSEANHAVVTISKDGQHVVGEGSHPSEAMDAAMAQFPAAIIAIPTTGEPRAVPVLDKPVESSVDASLQ